MRHDDLCGLRGWLVLVGVGVVISPIKLAITVLPTFVSLFRDGTWRALTTPGSDLYNPLWVPLLAGEITYNLALFIAVVLLNVFFFSKHRFFPHLYIGVVASSLIFLPLDSWLVSLVLKQSHAFDEETVTNLIRAAVGAAIWIPYMLKSQRVKATFTRGKKPTTPAPEDGAPPNLIELEARDDAL
jgi:hypothetical protein